LPEDLAGTVYYHPQTHNKLEKAGAEEYEKIEAILRPLGLKKENK